MLWRCWLGSRKGIRPVKNWVVRCWCGYLSGGADLHMAQLMPLPLAVSCFCKIQIGFAFLVPAHPGSPGQRAIKRVCVCVFVNRWICATNDLWYIWCWLTVSCFSIIQIGFTFLVQADLGSPGKRAVKRVCMCVCVGVDTYGHQAFCCWSGSAGFYLGPNEHYRLFLASTQKCICSHDTSASSALWLLNDNVLYYCTHSLTCLIVV